MESDDFEWYDMSKVDMNGLDIPDDGVLQYGTPV